MNAYEQRERDLDARIAASELEQTPVPAIEDSLPERLRRLYVDTGANYVQEAADTIERLTAERDALRVDAERYRWLRSRTAGLRDNARRQYFSFPSIFGGLRPVTDLMRGSVVQHLDAAIDAARTGSKQ